jgi:hypothetical protein
VGAAQVTLRSDPEWRASISNWPSETPGKIESFHKPISPIRHKAVHLRNDKGESQQLIAHKRVPTHAPFFQLF